MSTKRWRLKGVLCVNKCRTYVLYKQCLNTVFWGSFPTYSPSTLFNKFPGRVPTWWKRGLWVRGMWNRLRHMPRCMSSGELGTPQRQSFPSTSVCTAAWLNTILQHTTQHTESPHVTCCLATNSVKTTKWMPSMCSVQMFRCVSCWNNRSKCCSLLPKHEINLIQWDLSACWKGWLKATWSDRGFFIFIAKSCYTVQIIPIIA